MIEFFKKHSLFSLYGFIFMFMFYGVWATSGTSYLAYISLFFGSFVASYFIVSKVKLNFSIDTIFSFFKSEKAVLSMFFLSAGFVILHLISLGEIPSIKAYYSSDGDDISKIRAAITGDHHILFNYLNRILVHSLLPFTLLLLVIKNKSKLFYILLIISVFYAFALMQKSFIITILLPILIYSITTKKVLLTIFNISAILIVVYSLALISNPGLRNNNEHSELNEHHLNDEDISTKEKIQSSTVYRIFYGLKKRIIIVPGDMISKWFENIPSKLPFLGINGYRPIAIINGVEHQEYSRILYPMLYPKYHKRGIEGNLNTASFMYEYANFGTIGLVISGVLLAILFAVIEALFKDELILKLAINFYPVLVLSSSAISTLLFSGGWGIMIFLYFIFLYKKPLKKPTIKKQVA